MSCSRSKIAPISIKAQRQQISKRRQHVEKMIGVRNANRNMKFKRIPAAHKGQKQYPSQDQFSTNKWRCVRELHRSIRGVEKT
mmetsp:Transcript_1363/g.2238  ORF Transcript_1363/g.2238 Transcript_1363/m.2238 type:complete len:83 (-) Transcript_1363:66-314(-)